MTGHCPPELTLDPQSGLLPLALIESARQELAPYIIETPLLMSEYLNQHLNARILFKAEVLQKTGSFKIRGATYALLQLMKTTSNRRVVTFSSGNHAQGLAAAAQRLGFEATIVMPQDAPQIKIDSTRFYGPEIVFYDRHTQSREALAAKIAADTGAALIPSYDHPWIMTGQATCGWELYHQAKALGYSIDSLLCPASGGGLMSGVTSAVRGLSPQTQCFSVEPEDYDDLRQSFTVGERITITPQKPSICDALLMPTPGMHPFQILKDHLAGGLTASDTQAEAAMALIFNHLKLVTEPGGAIGLAAMLANPARFTGQTVAIILSGGNVDPTIFQRALSSHNS